MRYFETIDRRIDIGVVEHHEGRIAAELEAEPLHADGGLLVENLADGGRAGEADEAHRRMLAQHLADRRRVAGDDVEYALGDAGLLGEHGQRQRRQRRLVGGLQHHGAAGRQRRRDFSRDHRVREIPRRDRTADADRLLDREQARIRTLRRNGFAIDAAGFLGEELDIGGADVDLAQCLGERLALLGGEDQRKVLAIGDDQLEPFAQNVGALLGGVLGPGGKGPLGGFDRLGRIVRTKLRNLRKLDAGGGIVDGKDRRADPGAVDVAGLLQQRRVLQPVAQGGGGVLGACGGSRGHGVTPRSAIGSARNIGTDGA